MMVQTPCTVDGSWLEDAAPKTPSPHANQHKLTKRLGVNSEVLSPVDAKPYDSAAHAHNEVAGAVEQVTGRSVEEDALEGNTSCKHKTSYLFLLSDSDRPASLPCAASPRTSIAREASMVVSVQTSGGALAELSLVVSGQDDLVEKVSTEERSYEARSAKRKAHNSEVAAD